MADQDLDRNEAATPHKLLKARERGQTGKSADVVAAVVFAVAVVYLIRTEVRDGPKRSLGG